MSKKGILRLVSFIMLLVAVIFVFCALSNPGLGRGYCQELCAKMFAGSG